MSLSVSALLGLRAELLFELVALVGVCNAEDMEPNRGDRVSDFGDRARGSKEIRRGEGSGSSTLRSFISGSSSERGEGVRGGAGMGISHAMFSNCPVKVVVH